jgi:DNA/RNA endonuclease G (NUC1)
MYRNSFLLTSVFVSILFVEPALALSSNECMLNDEEEQASISEHIYGGRLNDSELYERRAYVMAYNHIQMQPLWSAWHINKEYRDTPPRESKWKTFRTDPELDGVADSDYKGWHGDPKYNFARGHIAPYFISGGDRDNDGKDAEVEENFKIIEDKDDACTVFEINYMSNISPQYHDRFNGTGGEWNLVETAVRGLVDKGDEYQIFAGPIFINGLSVEKIGSKNKDSSEWEIGIPHGFFKVIIDPPKNQAVAFLFDHAADLTKGCNIDTPASEEKCIVKIEDIEAITGFQFFSDFSEAKNKQLRDSSSANTWATWARK